MKFRSIILAGAMVTSLAGLFAACNSEDAVSPDDDTLDTLQSGVVVERTLLPSGIFPWDVDFDNKTMKRSKFLEEAIISTDSLIRGLNDLYPDVHLKKVKVSGDTLFVEIPKGTALTDRMGTNGAGSFMADAVINLTSGSDSLTYVNFSFQGGSHAQPGVYSMANYKDYKVIE